MRSILCKWFGHDWLRGAWMEALDGITKHRTDTCSRCGSHARWHSLIPRRR
jgi:hypothetical protein